MSEAYDPVDTSNRSAPRRAEASPNGTSSNGNPQEGQPAAYPPPPGYVPGYAPGYNPGYTPGFRPESGVYPPPPEYYLPRPYPPGAAPAPGYVPPPGYMPPPPYMVPPGYTAPPGYLGYPYPAPPSEHAAAGVVAARPAARGVGNPLWFIGSALVSFAVYASVGGWQFGLGLILLLFVHEMGHFVVIRAKGLPATLPIFIPFFGAFVTMRRIPKNVRDEAEIALAGPLAGALAGGACFAVYLSATGPDAQLWLYLAYFSFLINLLNLAPISPLDGGRVVGAISRWLFLLGFVGLAAAFVYSWERSQSLGALLLLTFIAWLWLTQTIARFRVSNREPYYAISVGARVYISILYLALIASLALAFYVTQNLLSGFPLFFQ